MCEMERFEVRVPTEKNITYKIVSYAVKEGSKVEKNQIIAEYEEYEKGSTYKNTLRSPHDGTVKQILVSLNEPITNSSGTVIIIEEECDHSIQVKGICAICGVDVNASQKATISIAYDSLGVTISSNMAAHFDRETVARLREQKKLALILDLDQTLIHTTTDTQLFHKYSQILSNKSDLLSFVLSSQDMIYYVKLRPNARQFLESMSKLYEMHVYTMGTREYAVKISKILDPDGSLFNQRILTREDSGSFLFKTISRIFPCDQSMVVVVDDRCDVWKGAENLCQIVPYEFFTGAEDINTAVHSVILNSNNIKKDIENAPETQNLPPNAEEISEEPTVGTTGEPILETTGEFTVETMGKPTVETTGKTTGENLVETPEYTSTVKKEGECIQITDEYIERDRELDIIINILKKVHYEYYNLLSKCDNTTREDCNTCKIMSAMKKMVLSGVKIVFSGMSTSGKSFENGDLWERTKSFGAECAYKLDESVTHLVSVRNNSLKAIQSRKYPHIYLINPKWLIHSMCRWEKQDEAEYLHEELQLTNQMSTELLFKPNGYSEYVSGEYKDSPDGNDKFEMHITKEEWDKMNSEVDEVLGTLSSSENTNTDETVKYAEEVSRICEKEDGGSEEEMENRERSIKDYSYKDRKEQTMDDGMRSHKYRRVITTDKLYEDNLGFVDEVWREINDNESLEDDVVEE